MLEIEAETAIDNVPVGQKPLGSQQARAARDAAAAPLVTEKHAVGARAMMYEPHARLMPQTEPISVPSPRLRPARKPRRAPTPPLSGPAEVMKYLGAEWKTMGASPLAAAHELLDGDEPVDDCAVCGGSLFQPADDDEGPFAMSPPKTSPRVCRCPPARPGG